MQIEVKARTFFEVRKGGKREKELFSPPHSAQPGLCSDAFLFRKSTGGPQPTLPHTRSKHSIKA